MIAESNSQSYKLFCTGRGYLRPIASTKVALSNDSMRSEMKWKSDGLESLRLCFLLQKESLLLLYFLSQLNDWFLNQIVPDAAIDIIFQLSKLVINPLNFAMKFLVGKLVAFFSAKLKYLKAKLTQEVRGLQIYFSFKEM